MQGRTNAARGPRLRAIAAATLAAVAAFALLTLATGSRAQSAAAPQPGMQLVGNFTMPEYVAHAPGPASAGLLFVVEDAGTIEVVDHGTILSHHFLDLRRMVEASGERGLLSMAFPPDYATSGRFYVYFTNHQGNNEVDEFRVSADPAAADVTTRRRVIVFSHPEFSNHNGGQLQFGPDGLLWITTGDGGGSGDPSENAQDLTSPLGKLLRIDPRENGSDRYSIPADNPFVGVPGRDQIWSYGFRNAWRFSFDRNHLVIGDVGQELWEEVDYDTVAGARGANFGWDNYEGRHLFEGPALSDQELPIHEYSSADGSGNCAVTGGYVIRDPALASLAGRYVYADFCAGELRTLTPTVHGAVGDAPLGVSVPQPTSFGEGRGGRIYVASLSGPVYRLIER